MIHIIIERSAPTMQVVHIAFSGTTYEETRDLARKLEFKKKVFDVDVLSFDSMIKLNSFLLERTQPQVVSVRSGPKASELLTSEMESRIESQAEGHIEAYQNQYYGTASSDVYNLIYNAHDDSLEREGFDLEFGEFFFKLADNDVVFDREEYADAAIKYFNDTVFYTLTK